MSDVRCPMFAWLPPFPIFETMEAISPQVMMLIAVSVLAYHVVIRAIFRRWAEPLRQQKRAQKRADERIEALEPTGDPMRDIEAETKIREEEGVSARPGCLLTVSVLGLHAGAVIAISLALWQLGGPLGDVFWWAGPAYVLFRLVLAFIEMLFKPDDWKEAGFGGMLVAFGMVCVFATGIALAYAFVPLGTLVFLLLLSGFSKIAWKVVPPRSGELPPVAMIFM